MKRIFTLLSILTLGLAATEQADACTGISLSASDGSRIVARTVEWAATPMQCGYVVSPRGHQHQSYTPSGANGLKYKGVYGYVGIYTEYEPFVVEGVNETGLSAGLFFFPQYGQYAPYNDKNNDSFGFKEVY
jgi:choloylglycine hydrolase